MRAPDIQAGAARKALTAGPDAAGQRLDQFLAAALAPELSRSRVQALIREAASRSPGRCSRAETQACGRRGDRHRTAGAGAAEPEAEDIPLSILHEDEQLIVIDKPAGLVVHPGAGNPRERWSTRSSTIAAIRFRALAA
jgi:23S rRNA pseudouridine1911/1915/1917 synthase